MIMDPISWSSFTFKLREWADACSYKLAIPDLTMALFQERSLPIHQPRFRFSRCMPKSQVYSFFEEIPQFKKNMGCTHPSISPSASGLLSKLIVLTDLADAWDSSKSAQEPCQESQNGTRGRILDLIK